MTDINFKHLKEVEQYLNKKYKENGYATYYDLYRGLGYIHEEPQEYNNYDDLLFRVRIGDPNNCIVFSIENEENIND